MVLDDCDLEDGMVAEFVSSLVVELDRTVESKSSGTVVIVTTSSGARTINRLAAKHLNSGGSLGDLQSSVILEYFREEPGLSPGLSSLLSLDNGRSIMTHLVPFLPLSRDTVRSCLTKLARDQGIHLSSHQVEAVLQMQQVTLAGDTEVVSTGCKQVVSKMDLVRGAGGGGVTDREL